MKEIIEDLGKRGLKVVAFVCECRNGQLQVLNYDNEGLVSFISEPVNVISINEKLGGRMVRPIAEISRRCGENQILKRLSSKNWMSGRRILA